MLSGFAEEKDIFYFPVIIDGKSQNVIVRNNNDGYAVWYVELEIDGKREDLPSELEDYFGNIEVGFDEDPEQLAKDMLLAFDHARKVVEYFHTKGAL